MQNNKSNFNQAFWLAVSYTCNMLVGILSSVILSRCFDKVQYGTYKQIMYIYSALFTVFQAGLPAVFTYFLPRYTREEGKYIVQKVQKLLFVLGLLCSLVLFVGSVPLSIMMRNPDLSMGLKVFSIFPLFTLPTLGVEGIYTVNKNTRFVAIYNIVTRILMLLCIVLPVLFIKNDFRVALLGWGFASFAAFVIAIIAKNRAYQDVDACSLPSLTREIWSYSVPIMVSSVIVMFFKFADQFFISRYFGTVAFADYSNGHTTLPFAVMFITPVRAILTPLFSKASKENDYNGAIKTLYSSMKQIAVLMVPLVVYAFLFAGDIMVFLYGNAYEKSYIFFRIVIVFNYLEMFVFSNILSAIGRTKIIMMFDIICTAFLWIIDYWVVTYCNASPYLVAGLFVLLNSMAHYFLPAIYLRKKEGINVVDKDTLAYIFKITVHCVVAGLLVYFLVVGMMPSTLALWRLTISIAIFYVLIITSSRILHVDYVKPLMRVLKRQ